MPSQKREIGDIGEYIATIFLKNKGFSILERNYRKPYGEIDIIAKKGDEIHFVEVKSLQNSSNDNSVSCETWKIEQKEEHNSVYLPEWNMRRSKIERFSNVIKKYISENKLYMNDICIDVCSIIYRTNTCVADIVFLENISLSK